MTTTQPGRRLMSRVVRILSPLATALVVMFRRQRRRALSSHPLSTIHLPRFSLVWGNREQRVSVRQEPAREPGLVNKPLTDRRSLMPTQPFLALITPVGGGEPPGIWGPGGPWPTPPIHLPPGGGGGGGVPMPPIYYPPGISGPPGPWPSPPIYLPPTGGGGQPPGIWGPPGPWPTPPIHLPSGGGQQPGVPTHPIVLPDPGQPGSPTHPIAPVPPGPDAGQPIYVVVPGHGVVGPIYVGSGAPKPDQGLPPTAQPKLGRG